MWSDSPAPARLAALQVRLRRLLPAVRRARDARRPLALRCGAAQMASRLSRRAGFVWLDDSVADRHLIAFAPLLRAYVQGGRGTVRGPAGSARVAVGGFELLQVAQRLAAEGGAQPRLFGHLGYELAAELETLRPFPAADVPVPDLGVGLHDLWLEGEGERWWLCGPGCWRQAGEIEALRQALERAAVAAGHGVEVAAGAIHSRPSAAGYRAAVRRTVARIHAGEIFETNLCRRFEATLPLSAAWNLYLRMRDTGAAAHGAFLRLPRAAILSRSPECYLRVRGRQVESLPIKGTRPREPDADRDARQLQALCTSEKDAAELAMIVDLVRNDLGRVCAPGTVRVQEHRAVMQLATVWHTYSRIGGRLAAGVDAAALLRASFPPGSITGAPKIAAVNVAIAEEPARRGAAMGAIGWLAAGGDLELSVAIRTAAVGAGKVVYHAGCGIVADSDPQEELDETEAKARVFLRALAASEHARLPRR